MRRNGRLRLCLAASAGGHLSQLLRLEPAWRSHELCFVTTGDLAAGELARRYGDCVYVLGESNREHPLKVVRVLWGCLRVLARERPDVIVSTGAAHGCLLCLLGKLMGAKVVWVDSVANVERPSLSGRIVRYVADLFLVQWPELAQRYARAQCLGTLV